MRCPRCLNEDVKLFKKLKGNYYCIKCIEFGRVFVDDELKSPMLHTSSCTDYDYQLNFELSDQQKVVAMQLIEYIKSNHDVLVYAACGAGKTEIVMPLISYAFFSGFKIGIAIPRKEVVVEIGERMQRAYPKKKIVCVYGGHTQKLDGDLIIATTHQMYRYYKSFDILIVDEADAFPYKNNEVLAQMCKNATKGQRVYLSATPDKTLRAAVAIEQMKMITLFERPHQGKLCMPKVVVGYKWYLIIKIFSFINKYHDKCILLFVPTIKQGKQLYHLLNYYYHCIFINSKSENRQQLFNEIKSKQYHVVITTSVLERGITIVDVQVIVYDATHMVFDEASLIQISGRVGRHKAYMAGECLLLATRKDRKLRTCLKTINRMNNE